MNGGFDKGAHVSPRVGRITKTPSKMKLPSFRYFPARICAAGLALFAMLPTSLSASPAMAKLLFVLKTKGSLSQEEYDMLVAAMRADEQAIDRKIAAIGSAAVSPSRAAEPAALDNRLAQAENRVGRLEQVLSSTKGQSEELYKVTDNTSPSTLSASELDALLADKWYERLKFKGYAQIRGDSILHSSGDSLHVPLDPFASDTGGMGLRRGRFVLGGDVTSHLYLYMQADFFGRIGGVSQNLVQARDLYGDVSLDPAREFRVRLGMSKIPYGWSNMQSSQNRLALERADAINSGVEGERDFGAILYWAPYKIRERFKDLVKTGLRGSGDYGVFAFGFYNGQGLNRADLNGSPHIVSRLTYPFEFDNGQILELGVQGYSGRFVPSVGAIGTGPGAFTPVVAGSGTSGRGVKDQRVGISAILYPQPFGLEAEWNWGRGPQLSQNMRTISAAPLSGGYVQASYRHVFPDQSELIPFVRWQTYDGARKMATNSPGNKVNEWSIGLRYIPYPELELSLMYNHGTRNNTSAAPYNLVKYDYIGLQAQINY